MKRILDPKFKYIPSHETDIRKTFKRVREEQAKQRQNVQPIRRKDVYTR